MKAFLAAVLAAATVASVNAVYGIDISAPMDANTASCLSKSAGADFAIVRCWCSYGGFDGNCPGSIANLWGAGFAHVDAYMFPCAGQDAAGQFNSLASSLSAAGTQFGQIWFDIETNPSTGCGWADQGSNCNYMQALVDACANAGLSCGVYASAYMWGNIMGNGCTAGGNLPLWYAHYDGSQSFDDFSPFGGWGTPAMKQYAGDDTVCGFGVDDNWYP
jgi:hypothetical protein